MLAYQRGYALARELFVIEIRGHGRAVRRLASRIVCRGFETEPDADTVAFVMRRHEFVETRRWPDANGKNASGKRVKSARMAHALFAEDLTAPIDDIMR